MGNLSKSVSSAPSRRFVLADNFAPKAKHDVMKTESSAFGGGTLAFRKKTPDAEVVPEGELQNSIKSILAGLD